MRLTRLAPQLVQLAFPWLDWEHYCRAVLPGIWAVNRTFNACHFGVVCPLTGERAF